MLLPQSLDDLRTGGHLVAQDPTADGGGERLQDLRRESLREGVERHGGRQAHDLPVAHDGVLALGLFPALAVASLRDHARGKLLHPRNGHQPNPLQVGQRQPGVPLQGVLHRGGARIAVLRRIGQLAHAHGVQKEQQHFFESCHTNHLFSYPITNSPGMQGLPLPRN